MNSKREYCDSAIVAGMIVAVLTLSMLVNGGDSFATKLPVRMPDARASKVSFSLFKHSQYTINKCREI
jgi:hypothetical protein